MQLKDIYTGTIKEKNLIVEENRKLKELLRLHGIHYPDHGIIPVGHQYNGSAGGMQIDNGYGYTADSTSSPNTRASVLTPPMSFNAPPTVSDYGQQSAYPHTSPQRMTGSRHEDQLSVDFVLASVPPKV